jgi:hypothetical protein
MRAFVVVAVLIIPLMLFGVSCKKETPESKELAFERSLQNSMSGQLLYAEAEEDDAGASYGSEEQESEGADVGYESDEEESEDVGYEPEEEGEDEEPTHESDEDEQA